MIAVKRSAPIIIHKRVLPIIESVFSSYNLSAVMNGDLDLFIDALSVADEAEKLAAAEESQECLSRT